MTGVRIHGRRGQGVLAAAELLAIAASLGGHRSQAAPAPGTTGAESVAYCWIDDGTAGRLDALIIADVAFLDHALAGLDADGYLLVNSGRGAGHLGTPIALRQERVITVPATEIATKLTGRPIPNAALAGGFAALTGVVTLDAVLTAVRQRFAGHTGKTNAEAALATYDIVRTEIADLATPCRR